MNTADLGFDPQSVDGNADYLIARAGRFESATMFRNADPSDRGIALRDAALLRLANERLPETIDLLLRASDAFLKIGSLQGFLLRALALGSRWSFQIGDAWPSVLAALFDRESESNYVHDTYVEAKDGQGDRRFFASFEDPRELLDLHIALLFLNERDRASDFQKLVRGRLRVFAPARVLSFDMDLDTYVRMLDALQGDPQREGSAIDTSGQLRRLVEARTVQLAEARNDEHHWQLGLEPLALMDLDLFIPFIFKNPELRLESALADADPIVRLTAARAGELRRLHEARSYEPPSRGPFAQ